MAIARSRRNGWAGLRAQRGRGVRNPLLLEPNWTTFYDLGVQLNQQMRPWRSFEDVGRELGVTKQNAYTICMVALGKLAWHTFRKVKPIK